MSADLHRPSAPGLERVVRRRASDQKTLLTADEEAAAQARIAAERDACNVGWSALGRDVKVGGPTWARPLPDAPRRKSDVEELLRDRGNGTLDIVKLSRREAVALGLVPTWRQRMATAWHVLRTWPYHQGIE